MKVELAYPPPENILVSHPAFGVCYWHEGKLYRATDSLELQPKTFLGDITKGWVSHPVTGGDPVFNVFEVKLKDGTTGKVGMSASDQKSAETAIRAKMGLDASAELKFVEALADANDAKFEELKMQPKVGGPDTTDAMQQNLQPAQPQTGHPHPTGKPTDPKLGFNDPRLAVPAEPVIHTRDGDQPAQAPTDPSAPVVGQEGTASETAPENVPAAPVPST